MVKKLVALLFWMTIVILCLVVPVSYPFSKWSVPFWIKDFLERFLSLFTLIAIVIFVILFKRLLHNPKE